MSTLREPNISICQAGKQFFWLVGKYSMDRFEKFIELDCGYAPTIELAWSAAREKFPQAELLRSVHANQGHLKLRRRSEYDRAVKHSATSKEYLYSKEFDPTAKLRGFSPVNRLKS